LEELDPEPPSAFSKLLRSLEVLLLLLFVPDKELFSDMTLPRNYIASM
jgi:hypothetical protein